GATPSATPGATPSPAPPGEPTRAPGQQPPAPSAAAADPETLRCIAGMHERERLAQFAKLCEGGCDRAELFAEAIRRANAMRPPEPESPRRPPARTPPTR